MVGERIGVNLIQFVRFRFAALVLVLLIGAAASTANAADPLRVQLTLPNNSSIRSHTGIPLQIELDWKQAGLIEGYLEVTFREAGYMSFYQQTFYTYRTPELVLTTGTKLLNAFLPATLLRAERASLTADIRFVSQHKTFTFEPISLLVPSGLQRRFLIGVVMSDVLADEYKTMYTRRLAFETIFDKPVHPVSVTNGDEIGSIIRQHKRKLGVTNNFTSSEIESELGSAIITRDERIEAFDLPKSANRLCAYDILIVADGALIRLTQAQLDALQTWIKAGGSALIETAGVGYRRHHLEFLNGLVAASQTEGATFALGENDSIKSSDVSSNSDAELMTPFLSFQPGLGRLLVTPQHVDDVLNAADAATIPDIWPRSALEPRLCQRVGMFLWQSRAGTEPWVPFSRVQSLRRPQSWGPPPELGTYSPDLDVLRVALTPSSVKTMPASSVMIMLLLFLLAISVGDYFLLGLIGKRVWTWVLFPVISLGFTWYTIQMARHYVGSSDFTSAVTFVDTDAAGEILRSSRFEMLFTTTERPAKTKVRGALMAPMADCLTTAEFRQKTFYLGSSRMSGSERRSEPAPDFMSVENTPPICSGSIPTAYEVERIMRKWTPQVARYTSLGSEVPVKVPGFTWKSDDIRTLVGDDDAMQQWADARFEEFDDVQVGVFAASIKHQYRQASDRKKSTAEADSVRWASVWEFVRTATVADRTGLFFVTPRIAPTGGSLLSDLATVDMTPGSTDVAVIVVVREGEEFFVFRHTIHGEPLQAENLLP